jgi:HlyD family secretion protein
VALPPTAAMPVLPHASIRQVNGVTGVWQLVDGDLCFVAVELGLADLDGNVQVRRGLKPGDRVVLYAEKVLTAHSRIHVVERLDGAAP